jgi:hypothetical protein
MGGGVRAVAGRDQGRGLFSDCFLWVEPEEWYISTIGTVCRCRHSFFDQKFV